MSQVCVVKDQRFSRHLEGVLHLENARRIQAFESIMKDPSLSGRWLEVMPRLATTQELSWVHTSGHIQQVAQSAGKKLTTFDLDTQTTSLSYATALLAVGGVFNLVDRIWKNKTKRGFAFVRPPGHHAEPDRAMGFCLFNNIALGARYLLERCGAKKVMVVDIDAHHGNGTQRAFYDTDEVLYVSMHQFPAYPGTGNFGETGTGRGEGFTVNVPLGKGQGDNDFGRIVHFLVRPLAETYQPDMMLVSCGFDLYMHDRMGGMRVSPLGYALISALLLEIAETNCNGRIAFIAEGGYSMKGIRQCGLSVMQTLCNVSSMKKSKIDRIKHSPPSRFSVLRKVLEIQKKYWDILNFK
jgi:acetoin utilization deacetylase AcuC-like enzyme